MSEEKHYFIIDVLYKDYEQMHQIFEALKAQKHHIVVNVCTHIRNSKVTKVSAKRFKKEIE